MFSENDASQEKFVALKNNSTAEDAFKEMSLPAYWSTMVASYSRVASTAIQLLMSFSSTWLCEACFSALLGIKNKARNKPVAELDQRYALSQWSATFFAQRTGLKLNCFCGQAFKKSKMFKQENTHIYSELKISILYCSDQSIKLFQSCCSSIAQFFVIVASQT